MEGERGKGSGERGGEGREGEEREGGEERKVERGGEGG